MNLASLLTALGGKRTGNFDEFVLDCWLCDGKQKLYFNIKKHVGYCQKCSTRIGLRGVLKELGLNPNSDSVKEMMAEHRALELSGASLRDNLASRFFTENAGSPVAKLPPAVMPPHFFLLQDVQDTPDGRKAIHYMEGRGFKASKLFAAGFGVCLDGYYAKRVIIPFYEDGQVVYWQARDFTGTADMKILNPRKWHCETGKSDVLFNYDEARKCDLVVVCESWGSAMAVGGCAVGLNGKSASEVQIKKLLSMRAETFIVLLDHGAEDKSVSLARTLSETRRALVALLPYGDPNEVPKSILKQTLADAKPFSGTTVLKALTISMSAPRPS